MDDIFPLLSDEEIKNAKKRIWNSIEAKLPERGLSAHQPVITRLKTLGGDLSVSRLLKVQAKERLLDLLPERTKQATFAKSFGKIFLLRRTWAVATLSVFFAVIFAPLFQFSPLASAGTTNVLEIAQGEAIVIREGERLEVTDALVLFEGDRIRTEEGSMAHIQFVDDSRLTLGPEADVLLTELFVHPGNRARTEIVVDHFEGRVWSQVLNLVSPDSFYAFRFPEGEIVNRQRASFDVNVRDDETEIQVARNLIEIMVVTEDEIHQGTLGQGVKMIVSDHIETSELTEEEMSDVWWSFNLSYGKKYAQLMDEKYQEAVKEVLILPGSPFYSLKTLQENVQTAMAITPESKNKLAVHHAETRMIEAKALLVQGNLEKAEEVLDEYNKAVDAAAELEGNEELIAFLEESQKELLSLDLDGSGLIEAHLEEASEALTNDASELAEVQMLMASQKLQWVPDLIAEGNFSMALEFLTAYRGKSMDALVELESVPLEERQDLIQQMLDQKLKDLHMLRVIAAMPELSGVLDIDAQILQDMSLMVLALRERELENLSEFVNADRFEEDVQFSLYSRLKDSVDLDPVVDEQFQNLEQQISLVSTGTVVVELTTTPVLNDSRFSDTHSDESED